MTVELFESIDITDNCLYTPSQVKLPSLLFFLLSPPFFSFYSSISRNWNCRQRLSLPGRAFLSRAKRRNSQGVWLSCWWMKAIKLWHFFKRTFLREAIETRPIAHNSCITAFNGNRFVWKSFLSSISFKYMASYHFFFFLLFFGFWSLRYKSKVLSAKPLKTKHWKQNSFFWSDGVAMIAMNHWSWLRLGVLLVDFFYLLYKTNWTLDSTGRRN